MNSIQLIGRLTNNPETKATQNGKSFSRFRLAVDRRFKKDGQPDADFIPCIAFGDFAGKYLQKGMKIGIVGRIQTGSYKRDDGSTAYTFDVIVEDITFCEKRYSGSPDVSSYSTTHGQQFSDIDDDDGDLPF